MCISRTREPRRWFSARGNVAQVVTRYSYSEHTLTQVYRLGLRQPWVGPHRECTVIPSGERNGALPPGEVKLRQGPTEVEAGIGSSRTPGNILR